MIADASRHFNRVVGIDLGGGKGKHTAVAIGVVTTAGLEIQSYGTRAAGGLPYYDHVLCELLAAQPPGTLVAMDAPLGLPACVRCSLARCPGFAACEDPAVEWMLGEGVALERAHRPRAPRNKPLITPYTQRVCEILLRCQHHIQPRETLGQGMGPLTARAIHLRRALAPSYRLGESLIEVYPKATIHQLAGSWAARRYKRHPSTWAVRAELLEQWTAELGFATWREESLRCDHSFDAVVCAYSGYLWATRGWILPDGYAEIAAIEGWIWIPEVAEPLRIV
jgi:predicted RNase H-like nuclease